MNNIQKLDIVCCHCQDKHKIRLYKSNDKYECPKEGKLFGIDSKFNAYILDNEERSKYSQPVYICGELLPLFEFPEVLTKDHEADGPSVEAENTKDCSVEAENTKDCSSEEIDKAEKQSSANNEIEDTKNCSLTVENGEIKSQGEEITKIGRYEIKKKIGMDEFGYIYEVYDSFLSRKAVLKLSRFKFENQEFEEYKKGTKLLTHLDHKNILKVYDFGLSNNGFCFIITEFMSGLEINLFMQQTRQIKNHDAFVICVCECFRDLTSALVEIHQKNIYHQDLKPQNILVSHETKNAKLCDFGLDGFNKTLGYSAPEKHEENFKPCPKSDIFSLGAVLFEMLTGRKAFQRTKKELFVPVVFEENDKVDLELQQICLKCLQEEKQDRYKSARNLQIDIMNYLAKKAFVEYSFLYFFGSNQTKELVFALKNNITFIGKTFENDITILNKEISGTHALIYKNDNDFFIENVSENENILINKDTIKSGQKKKLESFDSFEIGCCKFVYISKNDAKEKEQELVKGAKKQKKIPSLKKYKRVRNENDRFGTYLFYFFLACIAVIIVAMYLQLGSYDEILKSNKFKSIFFGK